MKSHKNDSNMQEEKLKELHSPFETAKILESDICLSDIFNFDDRSVSISSCRRLTENMKIVGRTYEKVNYLLCSQKNIEGGGIWYSFFENKKDAKPICPILFPTLKRLVGYDGTNGLAVFMFKRRRYTYNLKFNILRVS